MLRTFRIHCLFLLCNILLASVTHAASKPHVITFGKWTVAQWVPGTGAQDEKPVAIKVRALVVDGRVREFTLGTPHEVTDRLLVVRRVYRINDNLPDDPGVPRWQWQRGGWLLVDRLTGHISPISLPDFDAYYSAASWYRDSVAYCGVSDDSRKIYAIVAQLSRRKPVLKKLLSNNGPPEESSPDSACPEPSWQRRPMRVTFEPSGGAKQTFAIRGHVVDLVSDEEEEEAEATK